jgi:hypothetical protein
VVYSPGTEYIARDVDDELLEAIGAKGAWRVGGVRLPREVKDKEDGYQEPRGYQAQRYPEFI